MPFNSKASHHDDSARNLKYSVAQFLNTNSPTFQFSKLLTSPALLNTCQHHNNIVSVKDTPGRDYWHRYAETVNFYMTESSHTTRTQMAHKQLPDYVQALVNDPSIFPHPAPVIDLKQTHISYVILTGVRAYKIKKPVNLDFLDFSTLQKRLQFCAQEVLLNRKGAPGYYIGVALLRRNGNKFQLSEPMEPQAILNDTEILKDPSIVECAVVMNEFKQEYILDARLEQGTCSVEDFIRLGRCLAEYHMTCKATPNCKLFGCPNLIKKAFDQNYEQTEKYVGTLQTRQMLLETKSYTDSFFEKKSQILTQRCDQGYIRECHGDLHLKNIAMLPDGQFIFFDCMEFLEEWRCVDTMYDIAFIICGLIAKGKFEFCNEFLNSYLAWSNDINGLKVLKLYLSRQAYVKAKVDSFAYDDPYIPSEVKEQFAISAKLHYSLAWFVCQQRCAEIQGQLIAMSGVSGTGKSFWARRIANMLCQMDATAGRYKFALPVIILRSDVIRKQLAGVRIDSKLPPEMYSDHWTEKTYKKLRDTAKMLLEDGWSVILDAKYDRRRHRCSLVETLSPLPVRFVHLVAPLEQIKKRMEMRSMQQIKDPSDATFDLVTSQLNSFENFDSSEKAVVIDTSVSEHENVEALKAILTEEMS